MSHGRHAYNRARRRGGFSGRAEAQGQEWLDDIVRECPGSFPKIPHDAEDEINDEWYGEEEQ